MAIHYSKLYLRTPWMCQSFITCWSTRELFSKEC